MADDLQLPDVRRVETATGSYIEPPLNQDWPEGRKLAWHAAVVAVETGLRIRLWPLVGDSGRRELYGVGIGRASMAAYSYLSAWTLLNGISVGARAERQRAAAAVPSRVPPGERRLLSWLDEYSGPLPWANIQCRACGERELAKHVAGTPTDFVCMACGDIQKVDAHRGDSR